MTFKPMSNIKNVTYVHRVTFRIVLIQTACVTETTHQFLVWIN